jgi:hypothetical protein
VIYVTSGTPVSCTNETAHHNINKILLKVALNTIIIAPSVEVFSEYCQVIRIRISKKDRQHNGQKKRDKKTNNDLQNIHIKLKI